MPDLSELTIICVVADEKKNGTNMSAFLKIIRKFLLVCTAGLVLHSKTHLHVFALYNHNSYAHQTTPE